jgi:hypothetical protein
MPNFGRGGANIPKAKFFEASLLDPNTKKQLCLDLLGEIGARNVRNPRSDGEIIHSCPLPFGAHRNGDSNPSASLNFKRLTFNCLGCGAQGGLLWFIATMRGDDTFDGARQWLGEQTGIGGHLLEAHKLQEILESIFAQQDEKPGPLHVYPESTLKPWTFPRAHPYMTHQGNFGSIKCRGIPEENCQRFRIGYAEKYPMGFSINERTGERVERPPQERIVIPIFWDGKLVGWQARALDPADSPKYKNSVDCPRDRVLYGWPGKGQDVVLVESPMSVLRHCHHQPMVASFGKQLTERQLRILQGARSVTVWFDSDTAGWSGTQHAIDELKGYLPIRVVNWPYRDADPADIDDHTVASRIKDAVPWLTWKKPTWGDLSEWKGIS